MSKRKLTRKQAWRIEKVQQERVARADKKNAKIDANVNDGSLGAEQEGLVIAHYGTQVEIQSSNHSPEATEEGKANAPKKRCHMRTNLGSLVTGDRVIWRDAEPTGVVVAVLPRTSALSRPDPHGDMKTVAANIDNILVVVAPFPRPHSFLIDRYLVAAEAIGIKPVILLNKVDLIDDKNRHIVDGLTTMYRDLGYEVIHASTVLAPETECDDPQDGLDNLKHFLQGKTTVFVGQSGVGKSSLINKLLPGQDLRVGALTESTQRGTHTTTTAQLFHFPSTNGEDAGQLIDSPGIREFGLWHMDESTILEGFVELRDYIGLCKFRDCQHRHEPKCAILEAHARGEISDRRMESYFTLRDTIEDV
ncbi:MAG: ribosome biogenesis GTPase [Candidatus Endobugula sp.]|jgi:ribosome biogenesis GTPase